MKTPQLLLDDLPLLVARKLATFIGLNEAIVLQQVHFLLRMPHSGRKLHGEKWIWNTVPEWKKEHFPFWSERTIRYAIKSLETKGLLISCQPDGKMSRKKYYRINYAKVESLNADAAKFADSDAATSARWDAVNPAASLTETSSENSSTEKFMSKETSFASRAEVNLNFPAQWKPDSRTKEQKLASIKPPTDYPSEQEFVQWLESEEVDGVACHRGDLYKDLCIRKWHHWNDEHKRWIPIQHWKNYVLALDDKICSAND